MKIKKIINYISSAAFNILPSFIANLIAKLIYRILKNKSFDSLLFNNHYNGGEKDLIFLDFNNAIGDFIIISRTIKKLNEEGFKFDILTHIKFKGVLEKIELIDVKIIYKTKDIGLHYDLSPANNFFDVYNESKTLNLNYKNVYFFSKRLKLDSMLFLMNINYEKLILMKDIYCRNKLIKKVKNIYWIQVKSITLSLFFFLNKDKFKSEFVGDKSCRNLFLADYAYFIMANRLPKESLTNLSFEKYFLKKENKNTLCCILDKNPRGKELKIDYLISFIEDMSPNYKLITFGNSLVQEKYILKNSSINVNRMVLRTPRIIDFINEVSKCEKIITHDTSLLHIGMILNKETFLYINKDDRIYKYEREAWLGYQNLNLTKNVLPKKYFMYEELMDE